MIITNPLKNQEFLNKLDGSQERRIQARITALTWNEDPIEYIEGSITSGSINLDGTSNVRRTFNLTMISDEINYANFNWGLNTKIKLEIGVVNLVDSNYDDIIWMPQGLFVLTTFNSSQNVNNYTINISGKDKMCLLNGDISGSLNSSIDFGTIQNADGTITSLKIKDIIKNAVHVYGQEPLHNIIINNLDEYGYKLLEYRGSNTSDLYLLKLIRNEQGEEQPADYYINMTMNGDIKVYFFDTNGNPSNTKDLKDVRFDNDVEITVDNPPDYFHLTNNSTSSVYSARKISTGDVAGYQITDLVYAGELISKVGESLTSILDKIKNMLGNFEYFYDLDGRFVFQQKANNLYNNWTPLQTDEEKRTNQFYVDPEAKSLSYTFYNSQLFTSISHTPALNNLKNDFSIWGMRPSTNDVEVPVLLRFAIDRKPKYYKNAESIEGKEFYTVEYRNDANAVDWREIIYQMALDFYKEDLRDNLEAIIAERNPDFYPSGTTGYEQYYVDILGFWRDIYQPLTTTSEEWVDLPKDVVFYNKSNGNYVEVDKTNIMKSRLPEFEGIQIYEQIADHQFKLVPNDVSFEYNKNYWKKNDDNKYELINVFKDGIYWSRENFELNGWHKYVLSSPELLNFWFDFMGEGSSLDKYSSKAIGARSKAVSDNKAQAVYFKQVPEILFVTSEEYANLGSNIPMGKQYIQINDSLSGFFSISTRGKSAFNVLEEFLQDYTYCTETIQITSIPIFYLQPNIRVGITDTQQNIDGEYIISRISLPLTYNGTMQISATKAIDMLY